MRCLFVVLVLAGRPAIAEQVPTGAPQPEAPKSGEVLRLESELKAAEARFRDLQTKVPQALTDVQAARTAVDAGKAADELKALEGKGDENSKAKAKALDFKVTTLRSIINEDYPAVKDLESRLLGAQAGGDMAAMSAIQKSLVARKREMMRKMNEIDLRLAKATGDTNKARFLEQRLDQLRKQESEGAQPARSRRP